MTLLFLLSFFVVAKDKKLPCGLLQSDFFFQHPITTDLVVLAFSTFGALAPQHISRQSAPPFGPYHGLPKGSFKGCVQES